MDRTVDVSRKIGQTQKKKEKKRRKEKKKQTTIFIWLQLLKKL